MKIDLYHLFRKFHFSNFAFPIILNVLKVWSGAIGWETRVTVCKEAKVNLSSDAEVIGISVYTQTAPAAYRISDKLRKKGKIVILGGPHFRSPATYKEASSHCDIVVSSICREQWESLLVDITKEKLQPNTKKAIYIVDKEQHFQYPDNFFEAFKNLKWYQIPSVPTSIGCPYDCIFCSPYLQGKYILRDIETIYNEISKIKKKMVFLCDATFGLNKRFALDLMKGLAPLNKIIVVETSIMRLRDKDMLDALAFGGVKFIIVGIETTSMKMKKHGTNNLEDTLKKIIDYIHEKGMLIQGNFICGLDCDGPESFDKIYQLCSKLDLDSTMIDILTPYPNTRLYDQLQQQGRIFDTNWEHYDYNHVVYQPLQMSIKELVDGYLHLYHSFWVEKSIIRDAINLFKINGMNISSNIALVDKIYFKTDVKRKEKVLRKNYKQIQLIQQAN